MKIFLSYGHDQNVKLVARIKADLEAEGHECWMDTNEIKAGNDWRRAITDGIVSSEWVLSFLSRHACREWQENGQRKKGVCLDELAIAIGTKGSIVKTILVENPTEPDRFNTPLTVNHIQHLDMHDWQAQMDKGEEEYEVWYATKWAEILRIVKDPSNQKFAGEIDTLREKLLPLDNAARIGELMANDFVGREWLLEEIEIWLKDKTQQKTFCLTGEPGFGKSAIAAWLAYQNKPEIIAAHFCQYEELNYSDPGQVVRSIVFQMATRLPDYRLFLINKLKTLESQSNNLQMQQQLQTDAGSLAMMKPAELFKALIADAAGFVIEGGRQRFLVIIDALDEGGPELVEFLARHQGMLPQWIALFVTSRPNDAGVRQHLKMLNPHYQDVADTRNQDDVKGWIVTWLTGKGIPAQRQAEILQPLLAASQGNFHYLRTFRQMVEQDASLLENPDDYPEGLNSLYYSNFKRQFPDVEKYEKWQAPFLELIAAARVALPLNLARKVLQISKQDFNIKVLLPLGSLFIVKGEGDQQTIVPFHKSIRDWLTDYQCSDEYSVDAEAGHLKLGTVLWHEFIENKPLEGYILGELPYHLLNIDHDNLHTLVPDAATWETHRSRMVEIAEALNKALNYQQAESWYRIILRLDENLFGAEHAETATSLNDLANLLESQGDYTAAEPLYRRALAIYEKVLGTEHPHTATSLNNLAFLLQRQGDYTAAEPLYRSALAVREKVLGTEHPHTVSIINNLAGLLETQGDYPAAEALYQRVLAIREQELGAEHPATATSLNNLAGLLNYQGDYAAAEALHRRALAVREKVLGTEHPDTATSLNNLGVLLHNQGNYAAAEALLRDALTILEKVLGAEHPTTANSLNNLAGLLNNQGNYAEAEALYRRALAVREKVLGAEHPLTATSLNDLAMLLNNQGNYAEAEALYRRALAIRGKVLGAEHPLTATSLNDLAMLLDNQGNYAEAEALYRRALAIQEKVLGTEHPDTATSLNDLAELLKNQGDYAAAEVQYRRALNIREKMLGAEHPVTVTSLNKLARLLNSQSDYAAAEPLYRRALAIQEKMLGAEHPDTATSLNSLAILLDNQGDYAAAEPLYRRALNIREKVLGAEHPLTATSLNNLANLLDRQDDYAAAEPLYRRALAIYEHVLGAEHPDTIESKRCVALCLRQLGRYEEALNLFEQVLKARQTLLGDNHEDTLLTMSGIGMLYRMKGDAVIARQILNKALSLANDSLGVNNAYTRIIQEELNRLDAEVVGS